MPGEKASRGFPTGDLWSGNADRTTLAKPGVAVLGSNFSRLAERLERLELASQIQIDRAGSKRWFIG